LQIRAVPRQLKPKPPALQEYLRFPNLYPGVVPDAIQAAHAPQSTAWSSASSTWNCADFLLTPVPSAVLTTHEPLASATELAANKANEATKAPKNLHLCCSITHLFLNGSDARQIARKNVV